MADLKEANKL